MSHDTAPVFVPDAANPAAGCDPPDLIHLRDHVLEAEIGAFAGERDCHQRLRFSLEAALARRGAGAVDDVDRVLSYDVLVEAVAGALAAKRYDLLEALAEDIAARVLAHPQAAAIRVTVEKLDRVPGALGITIHRRPGQSATRIAVGAGAAILREAEVSTGTAALPQGAAIIVPEPPGLALPHGGDPVQMGLLALDQAAYALAARLGVEVAASRTELEAAAGAGRAVVWAPARMVREARALAPGDRILPERLADWLRATLEGSGQETDKPGRP